MIEETKRHKYIIVTGHGHIIKADGFDLEEEIDLFRLPRGEFYGYLSDDDSYSTDSVIWYNFRDLVAGYNPVSINPNGFTVYEVQND